ncbi:radical SAM protein [Myxococcota bacterium]|nr:radical SAM protein [Myxococcota bacterium]MBU1411930.1 radical SAM protein [Myxococcota bacterium]
MSDKPPAHDGIRVRRDGDAFRYFKSGGEPVPPDGGQPVPPDGGQPVPREFTCRHPYILELEITWACNLACPHCYVDAPRACPDELTLPEIRTVLAQARAAGMLELSLTGGEVCCRPDLMDVIAAGHEAGFPVRLVTNGTLVTQKIARAWKNAGIELVTVSLDGVDPAVHDTIRGPGSHAKTLAGIAALTEAGLSVSLIAAFSRINFGQLPALWDFARLHRLGLQAQMVSGKGRTPRDLLLSPHQYYELGEQIAAIFAAHPHRIVPMDDMVTPSNRFPLNQLARTWQKRCSGGILNLFVRANGDVTPCSALALPENVVGNIRDPGGLTMILEEERCRTNLEWCHAKNLHGICAGCPHADVCHGGCPDILLTLCRDRHENEYCYHRLETLAITEALLDPT